MNLYADRNDIDQEPWSGAPAPGGLPPMSLYDFHVRHEHDFVDDKGGIELPDAAAAYSEAVRSAVELLAETSESDPMQFEITDSAGAIVLKASIQGLATVPQRAAEYPAQGLTCRFLH